MAAEENEVEIVEGFDCEVGTVFIPSIVFVDHIKQPADGVCFVWFDQFIFLVLQHHVSGDLTLTYEGTAIARRKARPAVEVKLGLAGRIGCTCLGREGLERLLA